MGILVEFNPDLALRNISEHRKGNRAAEECIPETLEPGVVYPFLKVGQRNYWLKGEIPMLETDGEGHLSAPKASVLIIETTHYMDEGELWTRGKYKVVEVFTDATPRFNGFSRV